MKLPLVIFLLSLCFGCIKLDTLGDGKTDIKQAFSDIIADSLVERIAVSDEKLTHRFVHRVEEKRFFSDAQQADIFSLVFMGTGWLDSRVWLTITRLDGKVIYSDCFDSMALVNHDLLIEVSNPSDLDRADYIQKRAATFFDTNKFVIPAIRDPLEYEARYSDREVWNSIASTPNAVGFYYVLYEEKGKGVAYNCETGKADVYFNCC